MKREPEPLKDRMLKVADVGRRMGCSDDTVRRMLAKGLLPMVRGGAGGKMVRVSEAAVEAYIKANTK